MHQPNINIFLAFISAEDSEKNGHTSSQVEENYADQLELIYEVVLGWTGAKDSKCRSDAAECVGTLCLLVSKERVVRDLKKLVTMYLNLYKKSTILEEIFALTKGIANFLAACCTDDTLAVEHYLDDLFNAFFSHVCVVTEHSKYSSF